MNSNYDEKSSKTEYIAKDSALTSFKKAKISRNYFSGSRGHQIRSLERSERAQIFDKIVDSTTNKLMSSYA